MTNINKLIRKYPNRVPIIFKTNKKSLLKKSKYLVPKEFLMSDLIKIVRKNITIMPYESLYFFCNNLLIPTDANINELYVKYKNNSGENMNCLVIIYEVETSFG